MSKIKYFRNFILCGDLSYRCLLCKDTCASSGVVEKHLRRETHRKACNLQTCMPQYCKDSIFKVDPYYYCSFCNRTMQDIPDLKQHIDSDAHKNNKANPAAATIRVKVKDVDGTIFINTTPVSGLQWHGIIDQQCVICNVPAKHVYHHIHYNHDHLVKLAQARVSCINDKYYRIINRNTFQCFSCKKTFSLTEFGNHFANHSNNNNNTTNGMPLLKKDAPPPVLDKDGKKVKDCTMADNKSKYPTVLCATGMDKISNTEWDFELISAVEDELFYKNTENKSIICKECQQEVKISSKAICDHLFNHQNYQCNSTIYNAIKSHIEKLYVQQNYDHGAARSKAAAFANSNYIKLNPGGSKGYCMLCDKFMSASITIFKSHVDGAYHKGHLELKGIDRPRKHERGTYIPVSTVELIKTLQYSANLKTFLVNGSMPIAEESLFIMKRIKHGKYFEKTKCFACDETMTAEQEKEHCISWKHKSKLLDAKSISVDCLLIREIRPRLYHCGACNETLPYWETLLKHIKGYAHEIKYKHTVCTEFELRFDYSKTIAMDTNNDNRYMQLLNAVFNTKYVINLNKKS